MTELDTLWIFKGHYLALAKLADAAGEHDYMPLSAALRALLLDGVRIADRANQRFGLMVRIPVDPRAASSDFSESNAGVEFSNALMAGPPAPGVPVVNITLDEFLRLPAVRFADGVYSVRDLITAAANIGGGVHAEPTAKNAHLTPLVGALFGPSRSEGLEALKAVARHIRHAYEHLFSLSEGTSLGFAQMRDERMPLMVVSGVSRVLEFSGREFLEDGSPGGITPDFSVVLDLSLQAGSGSERFIYDIGSLASPGARVSVCQHRNDVFARLTTVCGAIIETGRVRVTPRRFVTLVASMVADDVGVALSISVEGRSMSVRRVVRDVGLGVQSRSTIGASLQRNGVFHGHGALMQWREGVVLKTCAPEDLKRVVEFMRAERPRRWIPRNGTEERVSRLYNQARVG